MHRCTFSLIETLIGFHISRRLPKLIKFLRATILHKHESLWAVFKNAFKFLVHNVILKNIVNLRHKTNIAQMIRNHLK